MASCKLRILIVEDHGVLGRFIAAALEGADWVVAGPFGDRRSALEAAQHLPLDLAVLDCFLQGQEAFAIYDALAARGIPCVLISGYPYARLPERLRDCRFLEKPFTVEALLAAVRAAAGGGGRD